MSNDPMHMGLCVHMFAYTLKKFHKNPHITVDLEEVELESSSF